MWFGNLNDTGSVVLHISVIARLAEDGQSYGVIIGELGGTEPAADLAVMVCSGNS